MREAYICAYVRTPIGRYGGSLSSVRADDLAAVPLKALRERLPNLDFEAVDDVIYGCAWPCCCRGCPARFPERP
jgi:acetyl-CoA acyltransferase